MRAAPSRGFTLIELIVVMVILAVSGIAVFSFIGIGTQIFVDSVGRDQLAGQSRFAVERITREVRDAVPASLRVATDNTSYTCLEFVPAVASGLYLQIPRPNADIPMQVVTPLENLAVGQRVLVNGLTAPQIYANSGAARSRIIASVATNTPAVGLSQLDIDGAFVSASPAQRFYVLEDAVSWCLEGFAPPRNIVRYSDYGREPNGDASQPNPATMAALGAGEIMAQGLTNYLAALNEEPFAVQAASLQRFGLVQLDWRFTRLEAPEPLVLYHEIQVWNVQ